MTQRGIGKKGYGYGEEERDKKSRKKITTYRVFMPITKIHNDGDLRAIHMTQDPHQPPSSEIEERDRKIEEKKR